ncbi:MAG: DNA-binding domain-containing protein, partial [Allgaiera sp.]|nr:DNA-binding domain-containing protein [Allgaiera sp.]
MPRLADRQRGFGAAILDAALPVPPGLVGPDGEPSARRFAVYRNNVIVGMIETLKAAYPVVHRLVGAEFFTAMAALYAAANPPRSPILLDYGDSFAGFLARFEPLAGLPYIADVARIERAWTEAYNAPEAEGLDDAALAGIDLRRVSEMRFSFHPSLRIVKSAFPALAIWHGNLEGNTPEPIDLEAGSEDTLIVRPEAVVEVHRLPPGAAEFIGSLLARSPVAAAARMAFQASAAFD